MTKAQAVSERAAFEAWVSTPPIAADISLAPRHNWPGQYRYGATQLMWEAWKQSRKHTFATVATPAAKPVPWNDAFLRPDMVPVMDLLKRELKKSVS